MEKVNIIKGACPICHGNVKGNRELKYFCKKCNLLFDREHLRLVKREVPKKPVPKPPEKDVTEAIDPVVVGKMTDKELEDKFIVSLKAGRYHAINCPYIRRIKRDNLFYFNKESDAKSKGYSPCVCMKKRLRKDKKYVRSKQGEEYHSTNCPWALKIKPENRVYFDDPEEAFGLRKHSCLMDQI